MGFQRHFHGDNLIQLAATYTGAKQHILGQHILGLALPPLLVNFASIALSLLEKRTSKFFQPTITPLLINILTLLPVVI